MGKIAYQPLLYERPKSTLGTWPSRRAILEQQCIYQKVFLSWHPHILVVKWMKLMSCRLRHLLNTCHREWSHLTSLGSSDTFCLLNRGLLDEIWWSWRHSGAHTTHVSWTWWMLNNLLAVSALCFCCVVWCCGVDVARRGIFRIIISKRGNSPFFSRWVDSCWSIVFLVDSGGYPVTSTTRCFPFLWTFLSNISRYERLFSLLAICLNISQHAYHTIPKPKLNSSYHTKHVELLTKAPCNWQSTISARYIFWRIWADCRTAVFHTLARSMTEFWFCAYCYLFLCWVMWIMLD